MSNYIPTTEEQQAQMLKEIGLKRIDELFESIPEKVRLNRKLNLPEKMSEPELAEHMYELAASNKNLDEYDCFLGAGAYDHYIPAVIEHITGRSEFYTAYTPYQPEISQGTLQAIFEYQTMICGLTGMDVSNASMYDGATALAEAAAMSCKVTGRKEILVPCAVHPEYKEVLKTYARFNGSVVVETEYKNGVTDIDALKSKISANTAAIIIQNPNFFGSIENLESFAELAHGNGALLIAYVDPVSLGILKAPGEAGADIVVGEGQSLGNPVSFGGPYLGFLAAKEKFMRKMPGRIVGQTVDKTGKRGFVLTMQAREQHIRREKATSNICSNQALNALAATVYLTVMGKKGLKEVAQLCVKKAHYAYKKLIETGKFKTVFTAPFFKEFLVKSEIPIQDLNKKLLDYKIIGGYPIEKNYPELKNCWLLAVTEKRSRKDIDRLASIAAELSSVGSGRLK
ncbi:MAG TPA: aminomethyl-transferring glycine dehydrogenase subunit GcvPA [Clostridiaceae bacterium]|nr:aminomethyl-transferring glycine dehydrogenase subunit GcvPA [Clostridiaceae bacterium]